MITFAPFYFYAIKMRITQQDYIKAHRKASRKEEIALHGKLISGRGKVEKSERTYDRKKAKAELRSLPFDFLCYEPLYFTFSQY